MKQTTKTILAVSALVGAALLTGCGGGSKKRADNYYSVAWYDVYGQVCGYDAPSAGCNFYSDGVQIIDEEDPYFANTNVLELKNWYFYDSYGYSDSYYGFAWESPTGIIYTETGYALNESDTEGRDTIGDVARQEKNMIEAAGAKFAAKHALSKEQGIKVARVLSDWATLGRDRARTEADIASFTERLYGVDFNKVKNALLEAQEGDNEKLNLAIGEAAENWGTDASTMEKILKRWYDQQ